MLYLLTAEKIAVNVDTYRKTQRQPFMNTYHFYADELGTDYIGTEEHYTIPFSEAERLSDVTKADVYIYQETEDGEGFLLKIEAA